MTPTNPGLATVADHSFFCSFASLVFFRFHWFPFTHVFLDCEKWLIAVWVLLYSADVLCSESFDCCALWLGFVCFDLLLNSCILPVMNKSLCSSSSIFLRRGATADLNRWTLNTSPLTASRPVASTARRATCSKTATAEWCTCQVWRHINILTDRPQL